MTAATGGVDRPLKAKNNRFVGPIGHSIMNDEMKQMVEHLKGAVARALADSVEVDEALQQIREQGWSLYLVVDRKPTSKALEAYEVSVRQDSSPSATSFRIDTTDLSFLRSIGIDPTRRTRRR